MTSTHNTYAETRRATLGVQNDRFIVTLPNGRLCAFNEFDEAAKFAKRLNKQDSQSMVLGLAVKHHAPTVHSAAYSSVVVHVYRWPCWLRTTGHDTTIRTFTANNGFLLASRMESRATVDFLFAPRDGSTVYPALTFKSAELAEAYCKRVRKAVREFNKTYHAAK